MTRSKRLWTVDAYCAVALLGCCCCLWSRDEDLVPGSGHRQIGDHVSPVSYPKHQERLVKKSVATVPVRPAFGKRTSRKNSPHSKQRFFRSISTYRPPLTQPSPSPPHTHFIPHFLERNIVIKTGCYSLPLSQLHLPYCTRVEAVAAGYATSQQ